MITREARGSQPPGFFLRGAATVDSDMEAARRVTLLSRVFAGFGLLLIAATWRLWTPQTVFPQIPMFHWGCRLPGWWDWPALAVMSVGLVGAVLPHGQRLGWTAFSMGWALSVLADQHRIQVWALHLAVAGTIIAGSPSRLDLARLRWLTIGIYAWSAVSKLDAGFLAEQGRMLFDGFLTAIGRDPASLSPAVKRAGPVMLVAGEALVAVALAIPRTRTGGLVLSLVMHAGLMLTLGPWGLRHEPGVLLWNGLFIVQNLILFRRLAVAPPPATNPPGDRNPIPARLALSIALGLPAFLDLGWWDVWPSWAVYSSRGGWTTVLVKAGDEEKLSPGARSHLRDPEPLSEWRRLEIDRWSLAALGCPEYPQQRFRLAVAMSLDVPVLIRTRSAPNRWTGATVDTEFEIARGDHNSAALDGNGQRRYWLNVVSRRRPAP